MTLPPRRLAWVGWVIKGGKKLAEVGGRQVDHAISHDSFELVGLTEGVPEGLPEVGIADTAVSEERIAIQLPINQEIKAGLLLR